MKIMITSFQWPSYKKGGVSLIAFKHANMLINSGHEVSICGTSLNIETENIKAVNKIFINASGSGSLYSPYKVDRIKLRDEIERVMPDIMIVEAWHSAIGDFTIRIAHDLSIPIMMVSHGISFSPFSYTFKEILRSVLWQYNKYFIFPNLFKKIDVLACLSLTSSSKRFYDLDLARYHNKNIKKISNSPVNFIENNNTFKDRSDSVVIIGYFSRVKAQLRAIKIAKELAQSGVVFKFIGKKEGAYYEKCKAASTTSNIFFLSDDEVSIASEISKSKLILSISIVEALPINLIEGIASGTPFVATDVGAVSELKGGVTAKYDHLLFKEHILKILKNQDYWMKLSAEGRKDYISNYSDSIVNNQLLSAIESIKRSS